MLGHSVILLLAGLLPGQTSGLDNLGFNRGNLSGWEGNGFYLTGANPQGPGTSFGVCSSDAGSPTRTGTLRMIFEVPPDVETITCKAFAAHGLGHEPENRLNVLLLDEGNRPVAKFVRSGKNWVPESHLQARRQGQAREYSWKVRNLAGQRLHIVLLDQDDRPGCYLFCSGFQVIRSQSNPDKDFLANMVDLQKKFRLASLYRYDSKRFTALSTADNSFTTQRLQHCEIFFDLFWDHFQRLGFPLASPSEKLKVAVFDSPRGFEIYLGRKMPANITGIYQLSKNCLVLYDQHDNPQLLASKDRALRGFRRTNSTLERRFEDLARDINLTTTMHEAAHMLSFNCGLLSRTGDVPLWLAEGLACYCEATDQGDWQALGSVNPDRVEDLRDPLRKGTLIPLLDLVRKDEWCLKNSLLGYAQSWALFRMLLRERPRDMGTYLALIQTRRAPDHRQTDFLQVFGPDPAALEQHYRHHLREVVEQTPPLKIR